MDKNLFKIYYSFKHKKQLVSPNHQPTLLLNNHYSQPVSQLEHQLDLFQSEYNSQFSSGYQSELSSKQSEQLSPRSFLPHNQTNLFSFENDSQLPPCYQSKLGDNELERISQSLPFHRQTNLFSTEYNSQFSSGYQSELSNKQSEQLSTPSFLLDNRTNLSLPELLLRDNETNFSLENDSQLSPWYQSDLSDNQFQDMFPFDNQSNLNLYKYNSQYSLNNQLEVQQFSSHLTQLEENIQQLPFDNETNCFSYDLEDSFLFESLMCKDKSQLLLPENYPELPYPENISQSLSGYKPESARIPSKPSSCVYESQVHSTNNWSKSDVSHSKILYNNEPFKSYGEPHPVSSIEDQNVNKFEEIVKNANVLCYDEYDKDYIPTYLESNDDNKTKILNIEKFLKLIKKTKPLLRFDTLTIQMLDEMTDKFVETVMNGACQFAKHRKGNTVIVEDVKLYLENVLNTKVPPGFVDFKNKYKKPVVTENHKARLALIKKTMKKYGKNNS